MARQPSWSHSLSAGEVSIVEPLVWKVSALKDELTGGQLISVFVKRRVQPLQHRVRPMWQYTGTDDSTRCSSKEFSDDDLLSRVQHVTKCTSMGDKSLVRPYAADVPLPRCLTWGLFYYMTGVCLIIDDALTCRIILLC